MSLEVTQRLKKAKDPDLAALQSYVERAEEQGLVESPVRADRKDDGETTVEIRLTYGPRKFTFPSIAKATKFLVLLTQTAEKARSDLNVPS